MNSWIMELGIYVSTLITFFSMTLGMQNIKMYQEHLVKKPKKIQLPPQIKQKHNELNNFSDSMIDDRIKYFRDRLSEKLTPEQQKILENNIRDLKLNKTLISKVIDKLKENGIEIKQGVGGFYHASDNKIVLLNESIEIVIFHELMHMATTVKEKETIYIGFCQVINGKGIGRGITEGYTQYITEKFFPEKTDTNLKAYPYELNIAKQLEKIIGEEKMQDLFFKADLNGLMQELAKYSSLEEAQYFIQQIDFINKYIYNFNPMLLDKNQIIQKNEEKINEYLTRVYINKLTNEESVSEDMNKKISDFITNLNSVSIKNKYRNTLTDESEMKKAM